MTPNRNQLAGETSPYLLQHADNPVDWHPWSAAALQKAQDEDKPLLVSIGYSACHWCHVMAHESFEDEATAAVMNELFVNIKIDREERPDLDKIYQTAQMLLTQRTGGWPLTMFLTPDQIPFFGGTYFPKESFHGLPPFTDLLKKVDKFYREHRQDIDNQNESMVTALQNLNGSQPVRADLDRSVISKARDQLEQGFDARFGGFGSAPKFPHPSNIERLLRHWAHERRHERDDKQALHMAVHTLDRMALGGIYDHLGGGFSRYSVDDQWMIPHFEKMLYDNGPLLALYAQAALATDSELYRNTAIETAAWVMREMQSPAGGYYSSLDADSEGGEGKYYVWSDGEIESLLDATDYSILAMRFGLDRAANFEGRWHLHVTTELDKIAAAQGVSVAQAQSRLDQSRARLFEVRERRVRPGRDDKVLTSWNALMIKGMATAGLLLDRPEYIDSATQALDFIRDTLWQDGRLLATYKDGRAHLNAYLDDYAFLIDAVLEMLQARWRSAELAFACALAEVLLTHFEDTEQGGFFFTADDHEPLIQRPKALADESTPSGNGIAARALQRLGYLVGETRYLHAAERTIQAAARQLDEAPIAHATLVDALEEQLRPPEIVILRGREDNLREWQAACTETYTPHRLVFAIPATAQDLPAALVDKAPQGEGVAYICEGLTCSQPVTERGELASRLAGPDTSP